MQTNTPHTNRLIQSLFISDKLPIAIIILNSIIIILEEYTISNPTIELLDVACSIYFVLEMLAKHAVYGIKDYWRNGWNKFDGILVILSIPSIILYFHPLPVADISVLLALRLFRVLRLFRIVHVFPDSFDKLIKGFRQACDACTAVLLCFLMVIAIMGLINCAFFRDVAPQYFGTPLDAIYSIFRLCTVEGWYEIPDSISENLSPFWASVSTLYFCIQLLLGGIIGMSFINSIFVDAMVADNNDDLNIKVNELNTKVDNLTQQITELRKILEEKK